MSGHLADGAGEPYRHRLRAWPCRGPPSRLLLVLALRGRVEVVQHTLDVFEGGPLLGAVLPAARHDVVELLGAVLWPGHAVSTLQRPDHLRVCHA